MIDLTKPIRRKSDGMVVQAWRNAIGIFERGKVVETLDIGTFECLYENIPEPRKPREWWVFLGSRGSDELHELHEHNEWCKKFNCVRVIEWPEGAPLPEWPT